MTTRTAKPSWEIFRTWRNIPLATTPLGKNDELTPLDQLYAISWPVSRLPEAVRALAIRSGLLSEGIETSVEVTYQNHSDNSDRYVDAIAQQWGIEAEALKIPYCDLEAILSRSGPALFRLPPRRKEDNKPHFVAVIKGGRRGVSLLGADTSTHRKGALFMRRALCTTLEAPLEPIINQLLADTDFAAGSKQRLQAHRSFLRQQLDKAQFEGCWSLRLPPSASLWQQARQLQFHHDLAVFVLTQAVQEVLRLATVGLLAQATASGQIGWGMLWAALLIWANRAPLTLLRTWSERLLVTKGSLLLKQRLFYGVLQLDLDLVERQGTGQFLSWVLESETIEMEGVSGGLFAVQMATTLVVMTIMLTFLAGAALGLPLILWLVFAGWWGSKKITRYNELNKLYGKMTNDLLECLLGHQTRLVQERSWHGEADEAMARYITTHQKYVKEITRYVTVIPLGWQLIIMAGLMNQIVSATSSNSPFTLGIYFMALSLGFTYIQSMAQTFPELVQALAAWQLIAPIQQAAETEPEHKPPLPMLATNQVDEHALVMDGQNLIFRYHERGPAILDKMTLKVREGDHLLLEGPSGGGKSTLATVLTNLNPLQSGLLLLRGLDRYTIGGMEWRQRIVYAPQFHQNHILSTSLAFNLLMGRRWPPSKGDLDDAEEICRELGLGELIDQMPQGLHEPVGDKGWQLSHGQRSRIYIARALLQEADFVILDESFASLDPESMEIALQCVLRRAPTLMVIAHP